MPLVTGKRSVCSNLNEQMVACWKQSSCAGVVADRFQKACAPVHGVAPQHPIHRDETLFPAQCPRCKRGIKLDWKFCPWCYGRSFTLVAHRKYSVEISLLMHPIDISLTLRIFIRIGQPFRMVLGTRVGKGIPSTPIPVFISVFYHFRYCFFFFGKNRILNKHI